MGQIIEIQKLTVGPRYLTARIHIEEEAPLFTNEDLEGTTRVYNLMPQICEHACFGDTGKTFKDALPATEIAHLFEHVSVELIARTGLGGAVSAGRTIPITSVDTRTFDVSLDCPDDALVAGALSSAAWILQWAYTGGGNPEPGIDAIVEGLVGMVASLDDVSADEHNDAPAPAQEGTSVPDQAAAMDETSDDEQKLAPEAELRAELRAESDAAEPGVE